MAIERRRQVGKGDIVYKPSRSLMFAAGVRLSLALGTPGSAQTGSGGSPPAQPSVLENFGFPYGFSLEQMDPKADPRKNFRRYASGRWMDAATIPSDTVRTSSIDVLAKRGFSACSARSPATSC